MSNTSYQKLSPTQLKAAGYSPKAERYVSNTGEILSKRQYQKARSIGQYSKAPTKDPAKQRAGRASGVSKRLAKITGKAPEAYKTFKKVRDPNGNPYEYGSQQSLEYKIERDKMLNKLFEMTDPEHWDELRAMLGSP